MCVFYSAPYNQNAYRYSRNKLVPISIVLASSRSIYTLAYRVTSVPVVFVYNAHIHSQGRVGMKLGLVKRKLTEEKSYSMHVGLALRPVKVQELG